MLASWTPCTNSARPGSGDFLPEIQRGHFLAWVPGFLGDYEAIKVVQISIRMVVGIITVAALAGNGVSFIMSIMMGC